MSRRIGLVRTPVRLYALKESNRADTLLRTKEKLQSGELLVRGDQWPLFLYTDLAYDPADPWSGLLRSQLLVSVRVSPSPSIVI